MTLTVTLKTFVRLDHLVLHLLLFVLLRLLLVLFPVSSSLPVRNLRAVSLIPLFYILSLVFFFCLVRPFS